ncbi:MAG: squalene/phytoene synthase family protein [Alphaproteobacteria bacterium]
MTAPSPCAAVVRRHDRERFACAQFAPPDRREDLLVLYALNLDLARVRERVREPMAGLIRFQWWSDVIEAIATGHGPPSGHPVAGPLGRVMVERGLGRAEFEHLIDARRRDLDDEPPADMAALLRYAGGTSAPLARLGAAILGVGADEDVDVDVDVDVDEDVLAATEAVALAWSLVGLLRAIPHLAAQGRVMLPRDRLASAGVDVAEVLAGRSPPGLAMVAAEMAAEAEAHIARARSFRGPGVRAALPLLLPATIAEGHLRRLRRTGHDTRDPLLWGPRPRVGTLLWNGVRGRF